MNCVQSSTMVRKNFDPFIELVAIGPHTSQLSRSKGNSEIETLTGKGNLCCFANGQIGQISFCLQDITGTMDWILF